MGGSEIQTAYSWCMPSVFIQARHLKRCWSTRIDTSWWYVRTPVNIDIFKWRISDNYILIGFQKSSIIKEDAMKHKSSKKPDDVISGSDDTLPQLQPEKPGVVKQFLNWITKGPKNICPTWQVKHWYLAWQAGTVSYVKPAMNWGVVRLSLAGQERW